MILFGTAELEYALPLTKRNMLKYYKKHEIVWSDKQFRNDWDKTCNGAIHYLATDTVVGVFRLAYSDDRKTLYLKDLQIEEDFRNKGIGSRFLEVFLDSYGKARHCKAAKLRVFEDNPAIALYQRFGFVESNRKDSLIEMTKQLET